MLNTIRLFGEIIVYYQSTINTYSILSQKWWVPLIKLMVGPTIYVKGGSCIYGTLGIPNNFLVIWVVSLLVWSVT